MPNLSTTQIHVADRSWLGSSHSIYQTPSGVLDLSTFNATQHFPRGYLPSGMPLGRRVSDKLWVLYNPNGSGGAERLTGFLLTEQAVNSPTGRIAAPVLRHGSIKLSKLPVPGVVPPSGTSSFVFIGASAVPPSPPPSSGFAATPFATSNFGGHA